MRDGSCFFLVSGGCAQQTFTEYKGNSPNRSAHKHPWRVGGRRPRVQPLGARIVFVKAEASAAAITVAVDDNCHRVATDKGKLSATDTNRKVDLDAMMSSNYTTI